MKVLIVEDNQDHADIIHESLAQADYILIFAQSKAAALEAMKKDNPDAILLDLGLPDGQGPELIDDFLAASPLAPIINLTTSPDSDLVLQCIRRGASDFLIKSELTFQELPARIENALKRKKIVDKVFYLNAELKSQNQKLKAANTTKDDLISIVSHDLKNPLSAIDSSLSLIEEFEDMHQKEAKVLIQRARRCADTAIHLVHDLLDLASLESGFKLDIQPVSILHILDAVTDSLVLKLKEKNINLHIDVDDDWVEGDYGRLLQVFSNVLGNAVKFTPENGHISISATSLHHEESNNPTLQIDISDTGRGIPEKHLESIFEKFEQSQHDDKHIGTGLGLAICKTICQQHNGKIWVESQENKGSTFHITLPKVAVSQSKYQNRVLLVDDNEDIHTIVRDAAENLNIEIVSAFSGEEAFQTLQEKQIDAILLDLKMEPLDGYEVLLRIREEKDYKDIPVLIHTSACEVNQQQISHLATDYIQKPAEEEELELRLARYLKTDTKHEKKRKKFQILVVDDEQEVREAISREIASDDTSVIIAKNGFEALFVADIFQPDLVITDFNMPAMDGLELSRALQKRNPNLPIFMISGDFDTLPHSHKIPPNISKFFQKPLKDFELSKSIATLNFEDKQKKSIEHSKIKVLIADDAPENRLIIQQYLSRKTDWELIFTENGLEAYEAFQSTTFDIVLMDVNMPVMSGTESILKIRQFEKDNHRSQTPVLAITANSQEHQVDSYLDVGYTGHLTKPIFKHNIIQIIHQAIENSSQLSVQQNL